MQPVSAGKTLVLGDTSFNPENEEPDINPQNAYSGWACIRYGVGETLFRYNDRMEPEPWLAADWSRTDDLTWRITLRAGVQFSTGRTMDAAAVKNVWNSWWRCTAGRRASWTWPASRPTA